MNENEPHISASCGSDGEVHFEIIPRDKEIEERQKSQIQKVGPYCRVSTLSEQQETSYEQQRLHYTEYVERHPGWELVDIYADHGISATSTKRRKAFNRLIEDCKSGAVTYIITKQVSRFARNTADCVRICRELKKLDPPVAVYFETEGLNTLSPNSELYLTFMAALAQGESDAKSLSMKWAIRSRFERKIPRITRLYGFDRHKLDSVVALEPNGIRNALPHNEDIRNVQLMYRWLLEGASISEIQERRKATPSGAPHPFVTYCRMRNTAGTLSCKRPLLKMSLNIRLSRMWDRSLFMCFGVSSRPPSLQPNGRRHSASSGPFP